MVVPSNLFWLRFLAGCLFWRECSSGVSQGFDVNWLPASQERHFDWYSGTLIDTLALLSFSQARGSFYNLISPPVKNVCTFKLLTGFL